MPRLAEVDARKPHALLAKRQLSRETGLSEHTIDQCIAMGCPRYSLVLRPGGQPLVRYRLSEVLAWLAGFREGQAPEGVAGDR